MEKEMQKKRNNLKLLRNKHMKLPKKEKKRGKKSRNLQFYSKFSYMGIKCLIKRNLKLLNE